MFKMGLDKGGHDVSDSGEDVISGSDKSVNYAPASDNARNGVDISKSSESGYI